jgi:hypothetical protein
MPLFAPVTTTRLPGWAPWTLAMEISYAARAVARAGVPSQKRDMVANEGKISLRAGDF